MKQFFIPILAAWFVAMTAPVGADEAAPFTYQGALKVQGQPANGRYSLRFTLHDAESYGNAVGVPVTLAPVLVSNGLFAVTLDFGATALAAPRWLEISTAPFDGSGPAVALSPRQAVAASPYAWHARTASSLTSLAGFPVDITVEGQRAVRYQAAGSATEAPAIIGGYRENVGAGGSTIGGGGSAAAPNRVAGSYGTVGGGAGNTAGAPAEPNTDHAWATIGGGLFNWSTGDYSTIGGGYHNFGTNEGTTIAGGFVNTASNYYATVSGGLYNFVQGYGGAIGGGGFNTIELADGLSGSGSYAVIAGGLNNRATGDNAAIGGGANNVAFGNSATIAGGSDNFVRANFATVGGGNRLAAEADNATVAGGGDNSVRAVYGFIGGGLGNAIGGGDAATIGGGNWNEITGTSIGAVIGGGNDNSIWGDSPSATIAGGYDNRIGTNGSDAFIGGGEQNVVTEPGATIAGGVGNSVTNMCATVGGGRANVSGGLASTVAGGESNVGSAQWATVAGGYGNTASGYLSFVGGGYGNQSTSDYAMVLGGEFNEATGILSFAAGQHAMSHHDGAFVWADRSERDFPSVTENEFAVRATGGVRLISAIDLDGTPAAGVSLPAGGGSWASLSDRQAKENFRPADSREILERVTALPMASWNYRTQDPGVRHLGPTAQDFHAAFGLGESDRTITSVDADGVALAAIQGLNQRLTDELKRKETEITDLKRRLESLENICRTLVK